MKKLSLMFGYVLVAIMMNGLYCENVNCKVSSVSKKTSSEREFVSDAKNMLDPTIGRIRKNVSVEKTIEVDSVNFIKLTNKPNEIFIPNPKVADVDLISDRSLYLVGVGPGNTSLVIHDKDGNVVADYSITVTYPIKRIRRAIEDIHPDLNIDIVSVDSSVAIMGKVPSPEVASDIMDIVGRFVDNAKIINKLSIETATQVLLKVKIAEVSREVTKSLGIDWRALTFSKGTGGVSYGFSSGATSLFPEYGEIGAFQTAITAKDSILGTTVNGGRWLVHAGGSNTLTGLLEALATENFASILAEPTLVALSGATATFKAGGEYGYTVKQDDGSGSNTTEFKEWGTSIEFTPTVLSEDRINIKVKPIVSSIVQNTTGDNTPSLTSKQAETTVELGSGQSLAIAGLLQTDKGSISRETPFLSELPFVGSLFRYSNVSLKEREIIIIVTPYIVKPSSKQLKLPTDMMPRMYSPLESVSKRRSHHKVSRIHSAGFAVR